MKYIELTRGKRTVVCDCHYGLVKNIHWQYHDNGYAIAGNYVDGVHKVTRMHRLINNTPLGYDTDHINGDKLDNQCSNLRNATRTQNNRNSKNRADNTSGHRGVTWDKVNNKWVAQITIHHKTKKLGRYKQIQDAIDAYNKASRLLFGDFHV